MPPLSLPLPTRRAAGRAAAAAAVVAVLLSSATGGRDALFAQNQTAPAAPHIDAAAQTRVIASR